MTSGFDLDLQTVEQEIEGGDESETPGERRIVLGVLDGTTDQREWFDVVDAGNVLVLSVDGDLRELAGELAPMVKERSGNVVHFRDFLIISPADVYIDSERL